MTNERPSFEAFFQREFAPVALVAGATCGDIARGEDIAQEALAKALQRWEELSLYDRPGAWVRRIAINMALNVKRQKRSEARALRLVGEPDVAAGPAERRGDPAVWHAIDALPPRQRAVVVMFYIDDASVSQIAEILEIAVSTATSHLHQARSSLAATLEGGLQ